MKRAFICLSFLLTLNLYAQDKHIKHQLVENELRAEEAIQELKFREALGFYLEYERLADSLLIEQNYNIGLCYLEIYHYKEALTYFSRCEKNSASLPSSYHYYYAKSLQLNNRFEKAKKHYLEYLAFIEYEKRYVKFVDEIKGELEHCDVALELVANPVQVEIQRLDDIVNSPFDDYSPVKSSDEKYIYFTSDRIVGVTDHQKELDKVYDENIFVTHKVNGNWTTPEEVEALNSKHHDASVALSHDGRQFIIYRYSHTDVFHRASGHLYLSKLDDGEWTKPKLLPIPISTKAREASACFSLDDKEIYFTSDREGGFGGTDIYRTRLKDDGNWSTPINLGEKVNTPYDEDAPFIHPDGKVLYFSSVGHRSMGGYDIFRSDVIGDHVFSNLVNIGYPINTPSDDISFSVSGDGKRVYFADNRAEGKGDIDIYFAEYYEKDEDLFVLKGKVLNQVDKTPLDVVINVKEKANDVVLSVFSSSIEGDFVIMLNEGKHYVLEIEKEGFLDFSEEIDIETMKGYNESEKDLFLIPKSLDVE